MSRTRDTAMTALILVRYGPSRPRWDQKVGINKSQNEPKVLTWSRSWQKLLTNSLDKSQLGLDLDLDQHKVLKGVYRLVKYLGLGLGLDLGWDSSLRLSKPPCLLKSNHLKCHFQTSKTYLSHSSPFNKKIIFFFRIQKLVFKVDGRKFRRVLQFFHRTFKQVQTRIDKVFIKSYV